MNILKCKKTALVALCIQNGLNSKGTIPILRERLLETGEFWMLKFIKTKVPKKKQGDWFVPDFPVPRQQSKLKDFH
jgi:hypothetical protein